MGGIIWSELFPTKLTLCIFIGYIVLFISQGMIESIKLLLLRITFNQYPNQLCDKCNCCLLLLGILVTASQDESSHYSYDTVCAVLFTELIKLVASVALYCKRLVVATIHEYDFKNSITIYFALQIA